MKDPGVDIAWPGYGNPRILIFEENRDLCFMSFWMINSPNVGLITGLDFSRFLGFFPPIVLACSEVSVCKAWTVIR